MEGEPPLNSQREIVPELTPNMELRPLVDELVEAHGFGPRSHYVETCWLPILGPTATWLYRRLGTWAELEPEDSQVDLVDLALSLGLGEGIGRNSKLAKGLDRLVRYDVVRLDAQGLAVRRALAPLTEYRAVTLSPSAYGFHRQATERLRTAL